MIEVKAPDQWDTSLNYPSVFLAGSIEMGSAAEWQHVVAERLINRDVILLNPRRDDWDSSWVQDISNEKFREQVEWELDNAEVADFMFVYFQPETKSPISLLELGLNAWRKEKMIVCCPAGFWRRGNVQIVCYRNNIPFYEHFDGAVNALENLL